MFVTKVERYESNMAEAKQYFARPAKITKGPGVREPGVLVKSGDHIKVILPVAEALRFANEIADALAAHSQKNN